MGILFEPRTVYTINHDQPHLVSLASPHDRWLSGEEQFSDIHQTDTAIIIGDSAPEDFLLFASRTDANFADEAEYVRTHYIRGKRRLSRYIHSDALLENPLPYMSRELARRVIGLAFEEINQFGIASLVGSAKQKFPDLAREPKRRG